MPIDGSTGISSRKTVARNGFPWAGRNGYTHKNGSRKWSNVTIKIHFMRIIHGALLHLKNATSKFTLCFGKMADGSEILNSQHCWPPTLWKHIPSADFQRTPETQKTPGTKRDVIWYWRFYDVCLWPEEIWCGTWHTDVLRKHFCPGKLKWETWTPWKKKVACLKGHICVKRT
jgi:hypothetical protein